MYRLTFVLSFVLISLFAWGNPKNGVVIEGNASFCSTKNGLEIHSGERTIIDWSSFSIDPGEVTRFFQSSSTAAVLNRVIGTEKSVIEGLLESNGHIFLVNKNGIVIGKEGVIEAASFIGSTLDLSNSQFLDNKDLLFKGESREAIVNYGTIHARTGDIFLIGPRIENGGDITAPQGTAGMGQGREILIAMSGEERIFIRKSIQAEEGAINEGILRAAEVEIKAGGHPFALAIQSGGEIEATGVEHRNGRVILVAEKGRTEVTGSIYADSGEVHILGNEVHLLDKGHVDVSGARGGTVLIGGDYQGQNLTIPNASSTFIDSGVTILANGTQGDGGKVIVWGDERTHYFGNISCCALGDEGDGGFVEISAKSNDYIFSGPVLASSKGGRAGSLLLDPVDISIKTGSTSPSFPTTPPGTYQPSGVSTATLDPSAITGVLDLGTDVMIDSSGAGGGSGEISFEDDVVWTGGGNLKVKAHRNIIVNAGVSLSSQSGDIILEAAGLGSGTFFGVDVQGSITSQSGSIQLDGIGSSSGSGRSGVFIRGSALLSTGTGGEIHVEGLSRSAGHTDGIRHRGEVSTTGTAPITFIGFADSSTTGLSDGIDIKQGAKILTVDGDIKLEGESIGFSSNSGGIDIAVGGATIAASGQGSITLKGTGSNNGAHLTHGVKVTSPIKVFSVHDGDLTIEGYAKGVGTICDGILLEGEGGVSDILIESTGQGNIFLRGEGSTTGTQDCPGIRMIDKNEIVSSGTGNIQLVGIGGAGANDGYGVTISDEAKIRATGSGSISIDGTAGSGNSDNYGVSIRGSNSLVSTATGALSIIGTGGTGAGGGHNVGTYIEGNASISSTSGLVSLKGTGGNGGSDSYGLELTTTGMIDSPGGITLEGTSTNGTNAHGVVIPVGETVQTSSAGNISITGSATGISGTGVVLHGDVEATGTGGIDINGSTTTSNGIGVLLEGTVTTNGTSPILITGNAPLPNFSAIEMNGTVQALGNGEIEYLASTNSITGIGISIGNGISFFAPSGSATATTRTPTCIFETQSDMGITNRNPSGGNFGGVVVNGSISIFQDGGDLVVNSVSVNGASRTGLKAQNQQISLTSFSGAITQSAGLSDAGTTGMVSLISSAGVSGIGPNGSFQTLAKNISLINMDSNDAIIQNRLNGSNALTSNVEINNFSGSTYYSQVGGSSINFEALASDQNATLLATDGQANMTFSDDVIIGGDIIAVANHDMEIKDINFTANTATFIVDQMIPLGVGGGTFKNDANFTITSDNLAIYAASGPESPLDALNFPPNQVVLESLASVKTWDQALPDGLATKYDTSYSGGGNYHGVGYGSDYTPGNGVFGSRVIWYKFDVYQHIIEPPQEVDINAIELDYLLEYGDISPSTPLLLVQIDLVPMPSLYKPEQSMCEKIKERICNRLKKQCKEGDKKACESYQNQCGKTKADIDQVERGKN